MSTSIRKSAFGRTQLFHDDSRKVYRELQCASSVVRRNEADSKFHSHGSSGNRSNCWHCCHPFEGQAIQLPRLYDATECLYHVYGSFCSLSCSKAYLLNLPFFQKEQHMYVFNRMCKELYGIHEVIEAPPRETLHMFGGPFSIEEFRSKNHRCVIQNPPFVSYCMIVEEKLESHNNTLNSVQRSCVRGIRIPRIVENRNNTVEVSDNCLSNRYEQYCQQQNSEPVAKKPKVEKKNASGGLGKFMK